MQKLARATGKVLHDEVSGLPLDPKLVADAIKEELMFMRKLQVYHEVSASYLGQVRIETHRDTMGLHEQG